MVANDKSSLLYWIRQLRSDASRSIWRASIDRCPEETNAEIAVAVAVALVGAPESLLTLSEKQVWDQTFGAPANSVGYTHPRVPFFTALKCCLFLGIDFH